MDGIYAKGAWYIICSFESSVGFGLSALTMRGRGRDFMLLNICMCRYFSELSMEI
jgi:hypothetical protein